MPEITLIGTGGMMPLKDRWLTSCYIEHNGKAVLVDCGEGTQIALAEYGCKISRIEILLITHVHADHISGLPGFLLSLGNSSRTSPLEIYLPEGTAHIVEKLTCICDRLPFEIHVRELPLSCEGRVPADTIDPLLEIKSLPLRHSTDCLGYSFTFGRKPVFLPESAQSLGIPVKYWKTLHSGENVRLEDGRLITPDMVTGDERPAVKLAYVTDTLPFSGISRFAEGADLFICEGMYGETDKKKSMNQKGHMLMQDACSLAAAAGAKRLWLTHYSPAEKHPKIYAKQLAKLFPNVTVSRDGEKITL
jgi:ribonuclease Z